MTTKTAAKTTKKRAESATNRKKVTAEPPVKKAPTSERGGPRTQSRKAADPASDGKKSATKKVSDAKKAAAKPTSVRKKSAAVDSTTKRISQATSGKSSGTAVAKRSNQKNSEGFAPNKPGVKAKKVPKSKNALIDAEAQINRDLVSKDVSKTTPVLPPNTLLASVIGHPDGYGFAKLDQGGEDLFLSDDQMRAVLHGDRVAVRAAGFARNDKVAGEIVSILQRANHRVVGKLKFKDGVWFVVAAERRINQDIVVPQNKLNKAALDQIVVVEITKQPTPYDDAIGEVVEIVGDEDASDIELEIAIRKHNLPHVFSQATLKEAAAYGERVRAADTKGRVDLRELPLVTIDGETAKDFDDAVYAEKSGKGYRLVVAIADVSHYVTLKSALDADARERTTSVYFPRRVIPMLPEALSNELCSLRPNVDRLCMVCDMKVAADGRISSFEFYAAVMNSKARLTYTEVAAKLPALTASKPKKGSVDASLKSLHELYEIFREARKVRGALDFEGQEAIFSFNDDGSVASIQPAIRNDAHKLIEEMMLAANVCAAEFLANAKQPLLYRVHDIPLPEKLATLRETLSLRGLSLGGGERPEPKDFAALIEQTRDRIDAPALHMTMLRALPQAIYTSKNAGHFGLAYEHYAHFTSPIRRYPDLLVHRGIKAALTKKKYSEADWDRLGEICSANERRADVASREVVQFLKAKFLESKLGEEFVGTISGVVPFGAFVTLDDTFADGLVHATTLPRDYYELGRDKVTLVGQRSGFTLSLGERVVVKVASVNPENAKIDFEFVARAREASDESSPSAEEESTPNRGEATHRKPRNSKQRSTFVRP